MRELNLGEWRELGRTDPEQWSVVLQENLRECIRKSGTSVVSANLSESAKPGPGPLGGVPYAIKDLFDYQGLPSHCSSVLPELLDCPARRDSALVEQLRARGGSCAAKAQMHEFAYGLSGENPHYGNCPHPRMADCLSGGSSSGSAHLVAGGYLPVAFGTDTGGSIRLPASWCGLYGVRWTPGRWMEGGFPLAESFDAMGWFTRTGMEMQQMLEAWFGLEGSGTSVPLRGELFLPKDFVSGETHAAITEAAGRWDLLEGDGFDELLGWLPECNGAFNVLQSGEAYAVHETWLCRYGDLYDPEVKARIERGARWTPEDVASAEKIREQIRAWFTAYFERNDFLAMPVCPGPSIAPEAATPDLREKTLKLTAPASLAGLPVLTLPIWLDSERSVGLQCIFKDVDLRVPLALLDRCENS
ncbi:MAG: amidase [Verrucomicrobia bacterium]|jgi:amidase/aspartyl-tRNA(Asn)/glutamyl-tRNA(Gln) amidotransferase subunit A|nr:amidase [Verrucomicrobiota bacterium]